MTFRHLEIFLIVCRTLSMTKAAEILHMSQPAVSKTIKELEDFYHTSLFERIGKTLQLSESGLALKQYAGTILSQYQESVSFLQEGTAARSCRLCTTVTIAETILPQLYQKIRSELPDLDLQISVCHTKEAEEKLRRHDCDIAIADRREDPSFEVIPLYKDTLVLAVSDRLFPQSHASSPRFAWPYQPFWPRWKHLHKHPADCSMPRQDQVWHKPLLPSSLRKASYSSPLRSSFFRDRPGCSAHVDRRVDYPVLTRQPDWRG